jgi:hypothetical protein
MFHLIVYELILIGSFFKSNSDLFALKKTSFQIEFKPHLQDITLRTTTTPAGTMVRQNIERLKDIELAKPYLNLKPTLNLTLNLTLILTLNLNLTLKLCL